MNKLASEYQIIDALCSGFLIHDDNYTIFEASNGLCKLFKTEKSDLIGSCFLDLMPEEQAHMYQNTAFSQTNIYHTTSFKVQDDQISKSHFLSRQYDFNDEQMLLVLIDNNFNKKLEDKRKANKHRQDVSKMIALGTLSASIAHEINNPIQYIALNTDLLKGCWNDSLSILDEYYQVSGNFLLGGIPYSSMRNKSKKIFSAIRDGTERIKKIAEQFKNFSKKDKNIEKKLENINIIIKTALTMAIEMIKTTSEGLKLKLDRDIPQVYCNYRQIEQVILNLVLNACQASKDITKPIIIETTHDRDSNSVIIKVQDKGKGIKREDLHHIFQPFFSTKRKDGGTGLGLSVSQNIVNEHNGNLHIESTPETGTTAIVKLPIPEKYNEGK